VILNKKNLLQFLVEAGQQLRGDWLLVGGTLLPAVGLDVRSTVDIDIVRLDEPLQTHDLLKLAEHLGLPIETVNSAAGYFLRKIGYNKKDLLPLHKGSHATIFRPSVALYWKLKSARMSDSDLLDCRHYLNYCRAQGDAVDYATLKKILAQAKGDSKEKNARLATLLAELRD
jgi:hypothetical protein